VFFNSSLRPGASAAAILTPPLPSTSWSLVQRIDVDAGVLEGLHHLLPRRQAEQWAAHPVAEGQVAHFQLWRLGGADAADRQQ
jgi:hypothetical protein